MLLKWLLLAPLFGSLANAVVHCKADLGTSIRPLDCLFAKVILYTKLSLSNPGDTNYFGALHSFTIDSLGDSRYRMPQGASFGSCGLGIDITPARSATTSWAVVFAQFDMLILGCPNSHLTPGRGGLAIMGAFNIFVVDPGQGMCILAGTCMAPNPSRQTPLPLLLELAGRYRGFQRVAASRLLQPVTTILPAPPALFHLGSTITTPNWPQYRIGGQWALNTDVWSPIFMGTALLTTHPRPVFILLTAVRSSPGQPTPFSRNFPRPMGAAWFRVNGNLIRVRGAWGARGSIWHPLTGDLTNLVSFVRIYEWVLVELGESNQAERSTLPDLRQALHIVVPNQGQVTSPQGSQRAGSAMGTQEAAGPSQAAADSDNQSEATIPNDVDESTPDDLLTDLGYGSQNQGQAAGSTGTQSLPTGSPVAGSLWRNPGRTYSVSGSALNTSAAAVPPEPTSLLQYFTNLESSSAQGDDTGRPFKRPRPNP